MYSGKTMKEVAVLKWGSGVGCYATAFAEVGPRCGKVVAEGDKEALVEASTSTSISASSSTLTSTSVAAPPTAQTGVLTSVQHRRDEKARSTHWLALGAKDGKVSLWDVY